MILHEVIFEIFEIFWGGHFEVAEISSESQFFLTSL